MVLCCYHLCTIKNWANLCKKKEKKTRDGENIHDEVVKLLLQITYVTMLSPNQWNFDMLQGYNYSEALKRKWGNIKLLELVVAKCKKSKALERPVLDGSQGFNVYWKYVGSKFWVLPGSNVSEGLWVRVLYWV